MAEGYEPNPRGITPILTSFNVNGANNVYETANVIDFGRLLIFSGNNYCTEAVGRHSRHILCSFASLGITLISDFPGGLYNDYNNGTTGIINTDGSNICFEPNVTGGLPANTYFKWYAIGYR